MGMTQFIVSSGAVLILVKILFNIILSSTPRSHK